MNDRPSTSRILKGRVSAPRGASYAVSSVRDFDQIVEVEVRGPDLDDSSRESISYAAPSHAFVGYTSFLYARLLIPYT